MCMWVTVCRLQRMLAEPSPASAQVRAHNLGATRGGTMLRLLLAMVL